MPRLSTTKKGFTIIEVVLVLAIAGLIFLMVFIALPALQRSQRDTQRGNDISRLITGITQYQSNNRGKVPGTSANGGDGTTWDAFLTNYMRTKGDDFSDPSAGDYTIVDKGALNSATGTPPTANDGKIFIYHNAKCEGEQIKKADTGNRQLAAALKREGAGVICRNN